MASICQLKPRFQSLLRPLVRRLAVSGITANGVTLPAMLISLVLGVLLGAMFDGVRSSPGRLRSDHTSG